MIFFAVKAKEAMDKMLIEMEERIVRETSQFESDKAAAIAKVEAEKDAVVRNLQHAQAEVRTELPFKFLKFCC